MENSSEENGKKKKNTFNFDHWIAFGILGGMFLGLILGIVFQDLPLYVGFGMILGMALAVDLRAVVKKRNTQEEKEEK
ncbi:MAG: hypothetical protein IJ794_06060 [Lachnospiraceae bacterium]|nr:hypothetical protein [Lachnospiraceae bacterium]